MKKTVIAVAAVLAVAVAGVITAKTVKEFNKNDDTVQGAAGIATETVMQNETDIPDNSIDSQLSADTDNTVECTKDENTASEEQTPVSEQTESSIDLTDMAGTIASLGLTKTEKADTYNVNILSLSEGLGTACTAGRFFNECADVPYNPIAAFRTLCKQGIFEKTDDAVSDGDNTVLTYRRYYDLNNETRAPFKCEHEYEVEKEPFTAIGCREALEEILDGISECKDGNGRESEGFSVMDDYLPTVHYSESDDCFYTYIVAKDGTSAGHVIAMYFFGDGTFITSVSFEYLCGTFTEGGVSGNTLRTAETHNKGIHYALALAASAENFMTGKTNLNNLSSVDDDELNKLLYAPAEDTLDGYRVTFNYGIYKDTTDCDDTDTVYRNELQLFTFCIE